MFASFAKCQQSSFWGDDDRRDTIGVIAVLSSLEYVYLVRGGEACLARDGEVCRGHQENC